MIGKVVSGKGEKIISPGMTESHYAPRKPMFLIDKDPDEMELNSLNAEFLDLDKFGDSANIAVNLFSEMRRLDESDKGIILCRRVEDKGIGIAINDKLERASRGKFKIENGKPVITNLKYA